MQPSTPLSAVLRTTQSHLEALEGMGIRTAGDLLLHFPRTHEDLTQVQTAAGSPLGEKVVLRGVLGRPQPIRTRSRLNILKAPFTDTEGTTITLEWFNQHHLQRTLKQGEEIYVTGKLAEQGAGLKMQNPTVDKSGGELVHAGRLVPVYPQHDIINTKWLREKMVLVRAAIPLLPETLDPKMVAEEGLPTRAQLVEWQHFPETPEQVARAEERLMFEEAFAVQREAVAQKLEWQGEKQDRLQLPMDVELIKLFFGSLKFTPTEDQRKAIYEILRDMENPSPMSRLLEGDVGSGKTLVAVAVIANAIRHGGQCALMVPTEVLARQHAESMSKMLINFHRYLQEKPDAPPFRLPSVAFLTGSLPAGDADAVRRSVATGTVDLVIGTHALIEDSVAFKNLVLVVVDEQHRFGVNQRRKLAEKGSPHVLSMTATPIPRTLALTAFGHHDLSVLLQKPSDRKPIDTRVIAPSERTSLERFIDRQISEGRQAFVVCPLIADSGNEEMADIKSVEAEADRLRGEFPHRRIAMLHGKLAANEKERIMQSFKAKEADILVSTSVIEVGIDVPNAAVIVIEGAERFGLSQLHQFRGRVGRGEHQSYCFLCPTTAQGARSERLKAMEKYASGFQLAEVDLKLRGPGELFGLRQSGLPEMRVSTLLNPALIMKARRAAERSLGLTGNEREAVYH
ncbi:MAG: ATP-dependent DNA helicase RecG [Candidatus Peribacteraceae bacterium]|nr:ATP-dependent DNA helicase RecG [Candidatus Peribacteraceae bacterium]